MESSDVERSLIFVKKIEENNSAMFEIKIL